MAIAAPTTGAPICAPFIPVVSWDTLLAFEGTAAEFANMAGLLRAASEVLGSQGPADVQRLLAAAEFMHGHLDDAFTAAIERGYREGRTRSRQD